MRWQIRCLKSGARIRLPTVRGSSTRRGAPPKGMTKRRSRLRRSAIQTSVLGRGRKHGLPSAAGKGSELCRHDWLHTQSRRLAHRLARPGFGEKPVPRFIPTTALVDPPPRDARSASRRLDCGVCRRRATARARTQWQVHPTRSIEMAQRSPGRLGSAPRSRPRARPRRPATLQSGSRSVRSSSPDSSSIPSAAQVHVASRWRTVHSSRSARR